VVVYKSGNDMQKPSVYAGLQEEYRVLVGLGTVEEEGGFGMAAGVFS